MRARFRPRLRFSLRTLLVLVTLIALLLGWQVRQIQERKEVIRWTQLALKAPYQLQDGDRVLICCNEPEVSWFRHQLGDHQYYWSCLRPEDPDELARILAAFPSSETRVYVAATRKLELVE